MKNNGCVILICIMLIGFESSCVCQESTVWAGMSRVPKLWMTVTAPKYTYVGREFKYTIAVKNVGLAEATYIRVVDLLPAGAEFKSASDNGTYNKGTVTWDLATPKPCESRELTIVAKAIKENMYPGWTNIARLTCREIVHEDRVVTLVEAIPAIYVDCYDTKDPVRVGDTTTYVYITRNEGFGMATHVRMLIKIPDQSSYITHEACTGVKSGSIKIDGIYDAESRLVIFNHIPLMGPGDSGVYKVTVRVEGVGNESCIGMFWPGGVSGQDITVEEHTRFYK